MRAVKRFLDRAVTRAAKKLAALPRDVAGGVLIYTAFAAPVMIGFTGLAVDGGVWYAEKRDVQSIADTAAVAGALELRRSGAGAVQQAAVSDATTNGYDSATGDTILVYNPPISGPRAGDTAAVEVVVRREAPLFFASLLIEKAETIAGRAVATIGGNQTCLWSLSKTKKGAVSVSGGSTVNLACGIFVNSDDDEALVESGKKSCITATAIRIVGGFSGDCVTKKPATKVGPLSDPLAEIKPPSVGGCDYVNKVTVNKGDTVELLPGVYCGGINVVAGGKVIFAPGNFILDGGGLNIAGKSTATGTGVSFYMTPAAKVADNISIQAGARVTMSAPTTGAQAGILFHMDKAANEKITHTIAGGATMTLDGILYFPNQGVKFAGGSDAKATSTMIIADTLTVTGRSKFGDLKNSTVGSNQYLTTVSIVE
jgi:hypothetical protein